MENPNGDDWREELFQKIRSMKEIYLPHLNEIYHRAADKLYHQESLPQQQRLEQFEKLKQFVTMIERVIQFLSVPKSSNIMPALKDKVDYYEKQIIGFLNKHMPRQLPKSQTIHAMQQNMSSSTPASSQGSAQNNYNGGDWQEEVFQKIKLMKEMYLPDLAEIYQRVEVKLHQQGSIPQLQKLDEFEKLKQFKTMLERMIQFLSVSKSNIMPALKDKVDYYEKQIIGFLNMHRPRNTVQQGQVPQSQMQPMQQQQPNALNNGQQVDNVGANYTFPICSKEKYDACIKG